MYVNANLLQVRNTSISGIFKYTIPSYPYFMYFLSLMLIKEFVLSDVLNLYIFLLISLHCCNQNFLY